MWMERCSEPLLADTVRVRGVNDAGAWSNRPNLAAWRGESGREEEALGIERAGLMLVVSMERVLVVQVRNALANTRAAGVAAWHGAMRQIGL